MWQFNEKALSLSVNAYVLSFKLKSCQKQLFLVQKSSELASRPTQMRQLSEKSLSLSVNSYVLSFKFNPDKSSYF